MRKLFLLFVFLISTVSHSLSIYKTDSLNFGDVVKGDKEVVLKNVKIFVKGIPNKKVRLYLDEQVYTKVGKINFTPKSEIIRLNNSGRGYFVLRCKLNPRYNKYGDINDRINFNVRYD